MCDIIQKDCSNCKLLIIDDNELNLNLLDILISKICRNILVIKAKSGIEAFEKLKYKIDIAIVDLHMPDMDGFDIANKLLEIQPDLKLIALTADITEETKQRCLKEKFSKIIYKPVSKEQIKDILLEYF